MYPEDLNGGPVDSEAAAASGESVDGATQSPGSPAPLDTAPDWASGSHSGAPDVVITPWPSTENGQVPVTSPPEVSPFLRELARAMLAAADRERERIYSELIEEAAEQVDKVQARAEAETEEIERQADDDQQRIHDWAEVEIERIHQEEARRLEERRNRLDDHLAQHATLIGAEIARVESTVETYRAQLDDFLARLAQEPSPIEIARLAGTLPDSPNFEEIRAAARAEAVAGLSRPVPPAPGVAAEDSISADLIGVMESRPSEVGS